MKSLIFTIAQNGYGFAYSRCIASQAAYAKAIGAEFVVVNKPMRVAESALSAWLKIPLLKSALNAGWDSVAYIDADCEVKGGAPHFSLPLQQSGSSNVHMALGRSGRVNSGVMLAQPTESSIGFLERVMQSITEAIPDDDRRDLKFENGNVIYVNRILEPVGPLATEWNNTFDPDLPDFIRHYTGVLRAEYRQSAAFSLTNKILRKTVFRQPPQPPSRDDAFVSRLERLTGQVLLQEAAFRRAK